MKLQEEKKKRISMKIHSRGFSWGFCRTSMSSLRSMKAWIVTEQFSLIGRNTHGVVYPYIRLKANIWLKKNWAKHHGLISKKNSTSSRRASGSPFRGCSRIRGCYHGRWQLLCSLPLKPLQWDRKWRWKTVILIILTLCGPKPVCVFMFWFSTKSLKSKNNTSNTFLKY